MKLFRLLRKPDWESTDATLRLRAVQSSQDPALLQRLSEFAQRDPAPAVRRAALLRLDDPALLARRLRGEHAAEVIEAARHRLAQIIADASRDEAERVALLDQANDAELVAHAALHAPEPSLRLAALARTSRAGFLVERCVGDPAHAVRMALLDRFDEPETLDRIADLARRSDKQLSRTARERAASLRLAAGDPASIRAHALALCEQLDQLARQLPDDRDTRLSALRDALQPLRASLDEALQRRVDGYLALAEAAIAGASAAPVTAAAAADTPATDAADAPATAMVPAEPAAPAVEALDPAIEARLADAAARLDTRDPEALAATLRTLQRSRADWTALPGANATSTARFDTLLADAKARLARLRDAASQQAAGAFAKQLDAVAQATRAGRARDTAEALVALDALGRAPQPLRERMAEVRAAADELLRWQRWSNNRARSRLCDALEALPAAGLHPDALSTRIRELQAEWAAIDALEPPRTARAEATAQPSGLERRFRGLCQRALAPARPYFEKRDALRDAREGELVTLLAAVDAALDGEPPRDVLQQQRNRLVEALNALSGLTPPVRKRLSAALRERLDRIDALRARAAESAALAKRRVIARLRRDLGSADPAQALALARDAQAEWKTLGRAGKAEDDALWNELRALVDPLYAKAREADDAQRAAETAQQREADAVLAELQALTDDAGDALLHADARIAQLQARWRAAQPARASEPERPARGRDGRDGRGPRDVHDARGAARPARRPESRHDDRRFDAALERVRAAQAQARAERAREELARIARAAQLCDAIETGTHTPDTADWTPDGLPTDVRSVLQARIERARAGTRGDAAAALAAAERLVVEAEWLAGCESPAEAAALRRQVQLDALAQRMAGASASADARSLLLRWIALSDVPAEARARLQPRFDAALRGL